TCIGQPFEHLWSDGCRIPQDELEERFPASEWMTCVGPAGTIIICDTVGFHRAGLSTTDARILATWMYLTPASLYQRRYTVDLRSHAESLSPSARYAIS